MKKSLLALVGVLALSSITFAQSGNTTTATNCTGGPCTVQGQTKLQAVKLEGLTLTVPNEIDFVLVDGQLNPGNQPLTAATTWNLVDNTGTAIGSYANIVVDAWFQGPDAMPATDGSGNVIPAVNIVGQLGGSGPQLHFGDAPPYNPNLAVTDYDFPIYNVPVTTNSPDGTSAIGNYSLDLNLFVDSIAAPAPFPALMPGAVYAGIVYVTAAAI